nr:MAG TPA: hypothetical protein [Caudoviricetes sp.]
MSIGSCLILLKLLIDCFYYSFACTSEDPIVLE